MSWLRPVNTCEVRRARRVCPRFVSCCRSRSTTSSPKKPSTREACFGERGLAQSGRPRRAKGRRGSNRGGKTTRSMLAREGVRKGVVVMGLRSMKGASDRRNRSFFTKERRWRAWPIPPEASARNRRRSRGGRQRCQRRVARGDIAGKNIPRKVARAGCRSVWRAVKRGTHRSARTAQVVSMNSGRRTIRGCLSISCEWQSSIARISESSPISVPPRRLPESPQPVSLTATPEVVLRHRKVARDESSPSHEGAHRAVDADAGGYRGERVRGALLRGRIRDGHPSTA